MQFLCVELLLDFLQTRKQYTLLHSIATPHRPHSLAIYQFRRSTFTYHCEGDTLDQVYSLVEAEEYSTAVTNLEILQHHIGYCGKTFQLHCKELLVECHCRINVTRPALQAVRETTKAMEESKVIVGPNLKLQQYRHLLIALDGKNTPPLIASLKRWIRGTPGFWKWR